MPLPQRQLVFRVAALSLLFLMSLTSARPADTSHLLFLGTYSRNGSQGIYSARLDGATGAISRPVLAAEMGDPTFLALHPNGKILYSIGEFTKDGKKAAGVSAYAMDAASGRLTLLNAEFSGGGGLTHLAVDSSAKMLIAVSYGSGYVVSFPLSADGRIGAPKSFVTHQGPLGPNKSRQDKPHAHSVTISPNNRFAVVADLGLDRVLCYKIDPATATLVPNDAPFVAVTPGAGPRHTKFSADGKFLYILGEIDGSVTTCAFDEATGKATSLQHLSTLPADFVVKDPDRAAEIRIHPNGHFVYTSNRGHDSIAVFARDPAKGTLSLVEITPTGGKEPRNFALSLDGAWLLSAHQNSNSLTVFRVDANTGRMTRVEGSTPATVPVCVLFVN